MKVFELPLVQQSYIYQHLLFLVYCLSSLFSILVLSSLFSPCCSISLVLHPCSLSIVLSLLSFPLSYLPCSFSLVLSLIYIRLGCNGLFPQLLTLHSRSVVLTLNDIASYIAFQSQLLASRNLAIQVPFSTTGRSGDAGTAGGGGKPLGDCPRPGKERSSKMACSAITNFLLTGL